MPFSVEVSDETAPLVTTYGSAPSKSSKSNKRLSYCCIFLFLTTLIIGASFVFGVMYANFNGTVPSFFNNNNNNHAKSHGFYSSKINGHSIRSNDDVSYECSTYPYFEDSNEDLEDPTQNVSDHRFVYYWCYLTSDECEHCYEEESEDGGICSSDGKYDCVDRCEQNNAEAAIDNGLATGTELFCYAGEEDISDDCFSYDTIVTKLIKYDDNNNNNNKPITEDIMIKDINLGDYLLTGLNGEFSKVIDKTHYTPYEGSLLKNLMRELCFDLEDSDDNDNVLNNCIKLTYNHLIYVNGIDLDSIKAARDIIIGDYLYHTGLNKMVKIISIKENLLEHYRGFVTENGNIIVNNGFYSSTLAAANRFNNPKYMHLSQVYVLNVFYKLFTFNGIYDGIWNNYYFDQILKLPTKSAILQWIGMRGLYREEYRYPLEYTICAQSIGFIFLYLFYKIFNSVLNFNKLINSKLKQC